MLPAKCAGRMGEQMIKSMTGFGRCEICEDNRKFTVEMKSVNHRYLDVNLKMPKKLNFFEAAIRNLLKEYSEARWMFLSPTRISDRRRSAFVIIRMWLRSIWII